MKSLLLVSVCIAAFSTATAAQCNIKLRIGAKVPVKCLPTEDDETRYVATHPSTFRPFIERVVAGVTYTIAFDEDTHQIKYIHTIDRAFRTSNGLRIGSHIRVSAKQITGGYGGWYTFAGRTPDGWDIIIADEPLNDWKEGETRMVTVGGFKKGGN
jgi:opacity protein-like surface antigen